MGQGRRQDLIQYIIPVPIICTDPASASDDEWMSRKGWVHSDVLTALIKRYLPKLPTHSAFRYGLFLSTAICATMHKHDPRSAMLCKAGLQV